MGWLLITLVLLSYPRPALSQGAGGGGGEINSFECHPSILKNYTDPELFDYSTNRCRYGQMHRDGYDKTGQKACRADTKANGPSASAEDRHNCACMSKAEAQRHQEGRVIYFAASAGTAGLFMLGWLWLGWFRFKWTPYWNDPKKPFWVAGYAASSQNGTEMQNQNQVSPAPADADSGKLPPNRVTAALSHTMGYYVRATYYFIVFVLVALTLGYGLAAGLTNIHGYAYRCGNIDSTHV